MLSIQEYLSPTLGTQEYLSPTLERTNKVTKTLLAELITLLRQAKKSTPFTIHLLASLTQETPLTSESLFAWRDTLFDLHTTYPEDAYSWMCLGWFHVRFHYYDIALSYIHGAIERDPSNMSFRFIRGHVSWLFTQDPCAFPLSEFRTQLLLTLAQSDFSSILTISPNCAGAKLGRARVLFALQEYTRALKDVEDLSILRPDLEEANDLRLVLLSYLN